jgi:hypothetical protein
MKRLMMALVSSFGVAVAYAQIQTPYGPDNGFFRPSPDVALTAPKSGSGTSTGQPAVQPFLTLQSPTLPFAAVPVPAVVTPVQNAAPVPNNAPVPNAASAPNTAPIPNAGAQQPPSQPPTPISAQAWAERQMDRSITEAERERARMQASPAGVGAAFDGTTSSENR